jgi:hypothetical protein
MKNYQLETKTVLNFKFEIIVPAEGLYARKGAQRSQRTTTDTTKVLIPLYTSWFVVTVVLRKPKMGTPPAPILQKVH